MKSLLFLIQDKLIKYLVVKQVNCSEFSPSEYSVLLRSLTRPPERTLLCSELLSLALWQFAAAAAAALSS